jgi:hypothetical protein
MQEISTISKCASLCLFSYLDVVLESDIARLIHGMIGRTRAIAIEQLSRADGSDSFVKVMCSN